MPPDVRGRVEPNMFNEDLMQQSELSSELESLIEEPVRVVI